MNRVLVTGANGFVGSNLVETLLAEGKEVTCLVRKGSDLTRLESLDVRLFLFEGFSDLDSLRHVIRSQEVVYHVAGATKALHRRTLFEVNEQGTRNVAIACAKQISPPVLVYISSLAACGPSPRERPRRETDPPEPVSQYGQSKLAGERAARELADQVATTIVRPAIILGPADVQGSTMFRLVRRWGIHVTPGGCHRYSVIHAADLSRLIQLAAERGRRVVVEEIDEPTRAQGCYFGASEDCPTWAELGQMVGHAVGRERVFNVHTLFSGAWGMATTVDAVAHVIGRPLYFNLDKAREIAAGSWVCSPQAAIDELGFSVGATLDERLKQTADWYEKAGWI
ncbi:MAG: NAD-dependent epimerase/dehydratase family protein [Pirellulales bacterium]|nr:NAD-dependent epimerase/dehydratase family protein [Pirellulales bacterium]